MVLCRPLPGNAVEGAAVLACFGRPTRSLDPANEPMTDSPLVSVLTPVWNCEAFLDEAVRSVWSQTYRPLEFVAVDDGSTDGSQSCLEALAAVSPIPMTVLSPGHKGIAGALNVGLAETRGNLVTLLHADDVLAPEKIERQVAKMAEDETALLVHCEYLGIDVEGNLTGQDSDLDLPPATGAALRRLLWLERDVRSMTVMFRRRFFSATGGYDETYPVEDWTSILRAASLGPILHVPEALVFRRVHGQNVSFVAHRKREFAVTEFGWPMIREVVPENLSLGRICVLHAGVVVRNAAAQGSWTKAFRGVKLLFQMFPAHAWRMPFSFMRGVVAHAWLRWIRPHAPAPLVRRLQSMRSKRSS